MNVKFVVEYQYIDSSEKQTKEFDDIIVAMKYQGNMLKKYKNKLDYCYCKQKTINE